MTRWTVGGRVRVVVTGAAVLLGVAPAAPVLAAPAGAAGAAPGAVATAAYTVVDLGTLPGGSISAASALNERGDVVGQSDGTAVLWRGGQVLDLGAGSGSTALDVNEFGQVVGVRTVGDGFRGFRWQDGKLAELPPLPGDTDSWAQSVNDRGQVVGFSSPSGLPTLWQPDNTPQDLSATKLVRASDVNGNGQVAGEIPVSVNHNVPALVTGGQATALTSTLGATVDVNELGEVTGFFLDDNAHGSFTWNNGRLTEIPMLPGAHVMQSKAVNDHGAVIGITDVAGSFLWDGLSLQKLPEPTGPLDVEDINNRGQIAGVALATSKNPNPHAILLLPA